MNSDIFASDNMYGALPYMTQGKVVHGFRRGSKELGIPTCNVKNPL